MLASLAILGALAAPLTLPILPIETFVRYQQAVGLAPSAGEHQSLGVLPQYYADMFGWREMAEKVAAVYAALPPQDRARAVFYGENYGEAAAIDVFGRRLGLPPAIGGHNSYYLWGPRGHDGSVMIVVGGSTKHYDEVFGSYTVAGHIQTPYAMPYENEPTHLCFTGPESPFAYLLADRQKLQLMSELPGQQELGMIGVNRVRQVIDSGLIGRCRLRSVTLFGQHTPEHEPGQSGPI